MIDAIVADQSFTDEEHEVWLVLHNELGQGAHQWLVVLHSTRGVDQHDVMTLLSCISNRILNPGLRHCLHRRRTALLYLCDG